MSKRKNQHYVPQFYLKNFSRNGDRKTINLFNPKKELFVKGASIKNQSSKDFFYGKDGSVEEGLSQIESILAPKIAEFTYSDILPNKYSDDHFAILIFMIINELRNPTWIEQIKSFSKLANEQIEEFSKGKSEGFIPETPHEMAVDLSFSNYEHILKICLDLDFKLLINQTENPFITCDFPSIKYNQFLEKKTIHGSITGYATTGLQIFLPLNSKKCILFYDSSIYKVGNRKDRSIDLTRKDVDQINILQVLNCWQNIYFNESVEESYVRQIHENSKKFKKANQPNASSHGVIKENEIIENEQIIHFSSTDLLINLDISKIKLTRRANYTDLGNGISPVRKKAKLIIEKSAANNGHK